VDPVIAKVISYFDKKTELSGDNLKNKKMIVLLVDIALEIFYLNFLIKTRKIFSLINFTIIFSLLLAEIYFP
jgi:hypothetical protein